MKPTPARPRPCHARHTGALLPDFSKVRILHCAAIEPVNHLSLRETLHGQGCSVSASALNRILLRMARNGWLKSAGRGSPDYSLTPKGCQALNLYRARLKDLVEVLDLERQSPRTRKLNNNGL